MKKFFLVLGSILLAAGSADIALVRAGEESKFGLSPEEVSRLDVAEEKMLAAAEKEYKADKFPEAVAGYAAFVKKFPKSPVAAYALYMQGRCAEQAGKKDDSIAPYKSLIEKYPKQIKYTVPAMITVADYHKSKEKPADAVRRKHPVGADHLAGPVLADHQVVAVLVEIVDVEPGFRRVQGGAHLLGEHEMP